MVYIIWILLAFLVPNQGGNRTIGYWPSFFISLLLSPLIGILIVLASSRKYSKNHNSNSSGSFNIDDFRQN